MEDLQLLNFHFLLRLLILPKLRTIELGVFARLVLGLIQLIVCATDAVPHRYHHLLRHRQMQEELITGSDVYAEAV